MRLADIDDEVIATAIDELHERMSEHIDMLVRVLANPRYSLPKRSRRRGYDEYPYFYAVDLAELFDFARGKIHMGASAVEQRCETLLHLLYSSPSGHQTQPNWPEFARTALGLCILASGARLALRQGQALTVQQVMLLGSWSEKHLIRSGLHPIEPEAERLLFRAQDVGRVFNELGIAV